MSAEIKEGFLCPICLKDLNSPTNLSSHFEEYHQNDGDVLQQVRSVFGKAKQKILKASPVSNSSDNVDLLQNQTNLVSNGTPGTGGIDLALWETQQIGTIYFYYPGLSLFLYISEGRVFHKGSMVCKAPSYSSGGPDLYTGQIFMRHWQLND